MGCGSSKKPESPPPVVILHRLGTQSDSSWSAPDRKYSCLSVPDVPVRRLSLSIPDAGKAGDTISIKTTNIHVESEDNVVQPVENVPVSTTKLTASEPSLTESSIKSSECDLKSMDIRMTEQTPAEPEEGGDGQNQTTDKTTSGKDSDGKDSKRTAKKHRLLSLTYLQVKISTAGIRAVLDELSEARNADPSNKDLEQLGMTLQLAQDALKYDPKQLPSQLVSRITAPTEGLLPLLEQCRGAEDLFLLSSQQLVVSPGGQLIHMVSEHASNIKCMTMTADGRYAITCSFNGIMLITDVVKGRPERKIVQVGKDPQEIFLCCNDTLIVTTHRSVVIAHRLETGKEAWKLEGEDLKIYPASICFAGHGQETMVIFENTSVLLYEASTATKLDTLDVPQNLEDSVKFHGYESIACAKSGYAVATDIGCACLTSVNLNSKTVLSKVMPDAQSQEDEHNLTIVALALLDGDDGKLYAIYTAEDDPDITFVDVTTLDVIKIYEGISPARPYSEELPDVCRFHVSPDQRYLYYPDSSHGVWVWDLTNARKCMILPEAKSLTGIMTVDMKIFVTITDDRNVRVWDVIQGPQPSAFDFQDRKITKMENGEKIVVREGQANEKGKGNGKVKHVRMIETDSPRYVLLKTEVNDSMFLQVFDVVTSTIVRQTKLGTSDTKVCHIQGSHVLLNMDRRLCVFDLDKMEIVTKFAGMVYKDTFTRVLNEGKEIVTTTKGGHHLKLYDTATGKVTEIIKQDVMSYGGKQTKTMNDFQVSKDCSVGIAELEVDFFIFDLVNRKFLRYIDESKLGRDFYGVFSDEYSALTDDGRYFLCLGEKGLGEGRTEHIIIYDIQSDTVVTNVLDMQSALKYIVDDNPDMSCDIKQLCLLDNSTIVTAHEDIIIRVFNMQDGKLLHRLEGHRDIPKLEIRADTPVFLSYVTSRNENSVRLWRKSDFTPLASFTMETTFQAVMLLPGHSEEFLVITADSDTPVIFTVHGQKKQAMLGNTTPLASYPQLYEGIKLDSVVDSLDGQADGDEDDPDTDIDDDSIYEDDDSC